jgi:hypothetical protein
VTSDTRISTTDWDSYTDGLVWTGSLFGIAWSESYREDRRLFLSVLDHDGTPVVDTVQPEGADERISSVSLAWTGSELALLWGKYLVDSSTEADLMFSRFGTDGAEISTHVVLESDRYYRYCGPLTLVGIELTMFCSGDYIRLSTAGEILGESPVSDTIHDTTGMYLSPHAMLWTGSDFTTIGSGDGTIDDPCHAEFDCSNLFTFRMSLEGVPLTDPVQLTDTMAKTTLSSAVWTGSEAGLTYYHDDGWSLDGFFSRISADGTRIGEDLPVHYWADALWTGTEYVLAWSEERDGSYNIFMNHIVYCE